jgi:predicted Zn-dependent protease
MGRVTVLNSITGGARRLLPAAALAAAACAASTKGEVQMGQQAADQATHALPMVTDPDINRYVTILGDSLAAVADTRDLEWHFYVVDSPEINAFALPGGFVFVNRGLIERVDSLDELAGVIGHEIGHVTQRHGVKLQQKGEIAQIGTGLACVLTHACTQAAGVGINAGEGAMFEKLLEERQRSPEKLEAWFINHPIEEDRIGFTLDAIDKMDRKQLESLTRDTPNFRKFKKRFDALPPYPPQPAN